ncbi:MAG: hypothetical protein H6842_15390 [Rhodospirillaceae bacterium]|nr:hypothetical protein [Rhodospirillaceae bacterium]
MSAFTSTIDVLVQISPWLGIAASYLVINKAWSRKHIREVAESISITAATLLALALLPLIASWIFIQGRYIAALAAVIWLVVAVIVILIGSKAWVPDRRKPRFFPRLAAAMKLELRELPALLVGMSRPRGSAEILEILQRLAVVDEDLDPREHRILQMVARSLGLELGEIPARMFSDASRDVDAIRRAAADYVGLEPRRDQVRQLIDLIEMMAKADRRISDRERAVLEEVVPLLSSYLQDEPTEGERFEVLLQAEMPEQWEAIALLMGKSVDLRQAGAGSVAIGCYHSRRFATLVARQLKSRGITATVESVTVSKGSDRRRKAETPPA